MSPEFLVNVHLCTAPQFQDIVCKKSHDWYKISKFCDMIGVRYIPQCCNLIDVRYRDTYPYAAIKIHTLMQGSDWRKQHTPLLTYIELFFVMKKEKLKNH